MLNKDYPQLVVCKKYWGEVEKMKVRLMPSKGERKKETDTKYGNIKLSKANILSLENVL